MYRPSQENRTIGSLWAVAWILMAFTSVTMKITAGPDGALWFGAYNYIGRITTSGVVTNLFPLPTYSGCCDPIGDIVTGPDGALWFAQSGYNMVGRPGQIGRMTTSGALTEYTVPSGNPQYMTVGPGGLMWFTEPGSAIVASITTSGVITEYPIGIAGSSPAGITIGPGGAVWFTDSGLGKVGELIFTTAALTVSPTSGTFAQRVTFTGSGFGPNERVAIYSQGIGSPPIASPLTNPDGSFTATAPVPQNPNGYKLFLSRGATSKKIGAEPFTIAPHVVVTPAAAPVAAIVNVSAYGFDSGESLQVYWDNSDTYLGITTTNVFGTFSGSAAITFTVPVGAVPGTHTILVRDANGSGLLATAPFTVQ